MIGVYTITCTSNGKVYVGSSSRNVARRWTQHRNHLKTGKHHSPPLQRAYDKYGKDAFVFELLEECEPQYCIGREQYWLNELRAADPKYGYNVLCTADSRSGTVCTETTRRKISKALRGREKTKEQKAAGIQAHPARSKSRKAWIDNIRKSKTACKLFATHVEDDSEMVFPSYNAAKKRGFKHEYIKRSLEEGTPYKGYIWKTEQPNT